MLQDLFKKQFIQNHINQFFIDIMKRIVEERNRNPRTVRVVLKTDSSVAVSVSRLVSDKSGFSATIAEHDPQQGTIDGVKSRRRQRDLSCRLESSIATCRDHRHGVGRSNRVVHRRRLRNDRNDAAIYCLFACDAPWNSGEMLRGNSRRTGGKGETRNIN